MGTRKEWTFEIAGMTCDHCATAVDAALGETPGVIESETRFSERRARVVADPATDSSTLVQAIEAKGYKVVGRSSSDSRREIGAPHDEFDLAIVGGGSASFAAAIRAADLGFTAAIIEGGTLGGTCVNVGCVPSKTLLRAAEALHRPGHHAFAGVRAHVAPLDFRALVEQKDALVSELRGTKYWNVLASYPSISVIEGHARFGRDGTLEVNGKPFRARRILLAMGARPWSPPVPGLDTVPFLTSTDALALTELPKSMIVLGGSAVGLELAQLFARLGTKITILEALDRIAPNEDAAASEALAGHLREEGLDVRPGATVRSVAQAAQRIRVEAEIGGRTETFETEKLLVATGRRPNTKDIGLEEAGIRLGNKGQVLVSERLETTRPGVYAAGDVIGDPMFVYVAAYAGSVAAENALTANARPYELRVLPRVTFTDPAVASVGLTEAQAREKGLSVLVSQVPLAHVPRAIAARDTRGFIKLVADERTNLLVGAHIVATEAGDIVQQAAMAIQFGIRVDQLASMLHPYLTLAEGIKLAAQTFKKDVAKLSCCAA